MKRKHIAGLAIGVLVTSQAVLAQQSFFAKAMVENKVTDIARRVHFLAYRKLRYQRAGSGSRRSIWTRCRRRRQGLAILARFRR